MAWQEALLELFTSGAVATTSPWTALASTCNQMAANTIAGHSTLLVMLRAALQLHTASAEHSMLRMAVQLALWQAAAPAWRQCMGSGALRLMVNHLHQAGASSAGGRCSRRFHL